MSSNKIIHRRNTILFSIITAYYLTQVIINIFIEGFASVFPPAYLFMVFGLTILVLLNKKVNPTITMYVIVSCMYIYFFYLLTDSPYLVNYLFMWLALPLSAIYQNFQVVLLAGFASVILNFYAFFYFEKEIFPNVGMEDFVYLVLFGVFVTVFLLIFIYKVNNTNGKLQDMAYRDPLTGAANRLMLKEKFEQLKDANSPSIALLFIDMNGFKRINDTYGHEVGDQLLEEVASRLNGVLRESDLLCRLGGDEFVTLLSNIDHDVPESISQRIQQALDRPIIKNEQKVEVSASIGWSYTTDVAQVDLDQMINEADRAMYHAKGSDLA
ncbi:GGDEF domain-containing protein [Ornithinibacillus californiensis]|uniref:GGDEF domain-containing protein n=1 Tax=Ornithinibacillus californiensis TaxID=161536 RepID=UPI00064D94CE|nr:GGDEF domain-containing protein [Ornithinibacillus californiensis]